MVVLMASLRLCVCMAAAGGDPAPSRLLHQARTGPLHTVGETAVGGLLVLCDQLVGVPRLKHEKLIGVVVDV